VAFLIIPEELHVKAQMFYHEVREENSGPFYGCPYIDSSWDLDKVNGAIEHGWPGNMI